MASDSSSREFFEACGWRGPWVVELADADRPQSVQRALTQPFAVLGRALRADLVLPITEVSRRHAVLQLIAGNVFCLDLGSRTGTHWPNGPRRWGWLDPREPISIGPVHVRVPASDSNKEPKAGWDFNPLEPCFAELAPLCPLTLEFLNGRFQHPQWQVDRVLTLIGSGAGAKVRLCGRSVAALHCYVLATPAGAWVVDLLSASGVIHQGKPVRFARLEDGDQVLIGGFLVRARLGKPHSAVANSGWAGSATAVGPGHIENDSTSSTSIEAGPIPGELHLLPSGQSLALRLPVSEAEQTGLVPVMNQFSLMQLQMFEQFQQTMLMMFQMFGQLQQEQMAALRHELDRVNDLTRELQILGDRLASATAHQPERPQAVRPETTAGQGSQQEPTKTIAPKADQPSGHPQRAAGAGNGAGTLKPSTALPATSLPDLRQSNGGQGSQDVHSWLLQRMETIQEERQSRWQRIMDMLGGKKQ